MPYLDFDSNESQSKMAASIKKMKTDLGTDLSAIPTPNLPEPPDFRDEELIKGHLWTYPGWSIPPLHIRRTLD
jgi:hypothetical protein